MRPDGLNLPHEFARDRLRSSGVGLRVLAASQDTVCQVASARTTWRLLLPQGGRALHALAPAGASALLRLFRNALSPSIHRAGCDASLSSQESSDNSGVRRSSGGRRLGRRSARLNPNASRVNPETSRRANMVVRSPHSPSLPIAFPRRQIPRVWQASPPGTHFSFLSLPPSNRKSWRRPFMNRTRARSPSVIRSG